MKLENCLIKILPKPHIFLWGKKINKAQCLLIFCKEGESNQCSHFMNSALQSQKENKIHLVCQHDISVGYDWPLSSLLLVSLTNKRMTLSTALHEIHKEVSILSFFHCSCTHFIAALGEND